MMPETIGKCPSCGEDFDTINTMNRPARPKFQVGICASCGEILTFGEDFREVEGGGLAAKLRVLTPVELDTLRASPQWAALDLLVRYIKSHPQPKRSDLSGEGSPCPLRRGMTLRMTDGIVPTSAEAVVIAVYTDLRDFFRAGMRPDEDTEEQMERLEQVASARGGVGIIVQSPHRPGPAGDWASFGLWTATRITWERNSTWR